MSFVIDSKEIETTETGFLLNAEDWSRAVATEIAKTQDIEMTDKHWDVIEYLRDEFFNHNGNQPNTRNIVKALKNKCPDTDVTAGSLYKLFPKDPSKQAGMIAGLPESRRKGGY